MPDIFMRFPGGRNKALTLSYDDGVEQDIRLIQIMNQYGLKGTFNLNSGLYAKEGAVYPKGQIHRRMTRKQATALYRHSGQEVAVHTLTHPYLEQLPVERILHEIARDRENLETQFESIVRGMAYPYGTFNDQVIEVLRSCGIVYARTVMASNDFGIPRNWMRLTTTCHHDSPELMNLAGKFLRDTVTGAPYLFYLWGHSYEFEANDNWEVIEKFSESVGNREDIWYATNIEIYNYIEAYNRLTFGIGGKRVKNPSNMKIWFRYSGITREIEPGAEMEL